MKKSILSMIILILFLMTAVSDASYLIRLKNGGELITPLYWVKGDQIKFYIYGGVVGIHKDCVKEIKGKFTGMIFDQEPEIREEKISEKKSAENSGKKDSPESLGNDLPKKQIQEELVKIQAESTEVWDEYRKMSEQEHVSKAERDKAHQRVFEIGTKKQELIRKLHEKNQK